MASATCRQVWCTKSSASWVTVKLPTNHLPRCSTTPACKAASYYGPYVGDRHVATGFHVQRPVYGHEGGSVLSTSFNPWLFEAHPVLAARQHFLSVLTGQVLAGVDINDICLCDNFYTPHLEPQPMTGWWQWSMNWRQFVTAVRRAIHFR